MLPLIVQQKDKQKFNSWIKILNEHKIINLSNSNLIIENISKKGEDIYYSDGAHLNENGNKILENRLLSS